jgi:hypothetical protein
MATTRELMFAASGTTTTHIAVSTFFAACMPNLSPQHVACNAWARVQCIHSRHIRGRCANQPPPHTFCTCWPHDNHMMTDPPVPSTWPCRILGRKTWRRRRRRQRQQPRVVNTSGLPREARQGNHDSPGGEARHCHLGLAVSSGSRRPRALAGGNGALAASMVQLR